eukprot:1157627-Pelagomonas_calceolata.AAC.9
MAVVRLAGGGRRHTSKHQKARKAGLLTLTKQAPLMSSPQSHTCKTLMAEPLVAVMSLKPLLSRNWPVSCVMVTPINRAHCGAEGSSTTCEGYPSSNGTRVTLATTKWYHQVSVKVVCAPWSMRMATKAPAFVQYIITSKHDRMSS